MQNGHFSIIIALINLKYSEINLHTSNFSQTAFDDQLQNMNLTDENALIQGNIGDAYLM